MGLAITLRYKANINKFRDIMIGSIASGVGNRALMTSGFFQENAIFYGKASAYQATQEPNLVHALISNSVRLMTVGVHANGTARNSWIASYKNFASNLSKGGVHITPMLHPKLRWHAKVFVLMNNTQPIMAIIGSSNITRPAFSDTPPFNNECDVIIWSEQFSKIGDLVRAHFSDVDDQGFGMIVGGYSPEENRGLTEEMRMNWLLDQMSLETLIPLELGE